MISVIICSANKKLLNQVSENISATVGVPFEIIAIDNSKAEQGICSVYNQGALKARYDILCFMHEDVLIKTNNWGQTVVSLFNNDPQLGLVGVAGSTYKPLSPSGWRGIDIDTTYINIIQSFKRVDQESRLDYRNPDNKTLAKVADVDGVWLCTTKKIAQEIRFDEITFHGFHGYDVDFSLSVGKKYTVAVTFGVLLDHFSEGNYDSTWAKETLKLHLKWHNHLPVGIETVTPKQSARIEKKTFKNFTSEWISFNYPLNTLFKLLWKNNSFLKHNAMLFFKLNFHLFKRWRKIQKK